MYFKVTYSAIYNWKGSGTEQEQNDPGLMDSFCHLIIAQEATTEATWIILIDQGEDTGVPTTNCIQYIIPRICERFKLKIANLRAFEVWPYHQGDPRLKYTEVVISDISFDDDNERVLRNSWRPTDDKDAKILDQLIETVGDKVIREEV
ncbi:hypothetical protein [Desulfobacter postgatei]|uniref:Uncharacterized protein n=1 Tax=Desulfobacter postgatei 2ac9 TaxID=879212 RepID=I5B687_9BACT|nr:hypothetical protein [Desulfobacter postgatei]EIM65000.1 hypothetical protein DespoDRAFT_03219 [Desulfobacter postgatei 2ac9]